MPITQSAFDPSQLAQTLAPFTGQTVLLGFSGGGDSLALLLSATHWARANSAELIPVIIDHALRPESAKEADWASKRAEALELAPVLIRWMGDKPASGLQAAARQFRLKTFAGLAHERAAKAVLLGHTLDDQAETVWRRLMSGGGANALNAMSEVDAFPLWPEGRGLEIVRPLLGTRRADLRNWLQQRGENWIDDPSNDSRAFARVRDRQTLDTLEASNFDISRLAALASRLASQRQSRAANAADWIANYAELKAWGGVRLAAGTSIPLEAMDALRAAVTGQPESDMPSARKLAEALVNKQAATAGGAALAIDGSSAWLIRDPGAVLGRADGGAQAPKHVPVADSIIWDGRFGLHNFAGEIQPLGRNKPDSLSLETLKSVPPLARSGLACLWKAQEFEGVAGLTLTEENANWLGPELISRNLLGTKASGATHKKLRGELAEGSH